MSAELYIAGLIGLVIFAGSVAAASVAIRAVLLRGRFGPSARLAEIVIGSAISIVVAQILGAIGLFRWWALVLAGSAFALLVASVARRFGTEVAAAPEKPAAGKLWMLLAAVSVALTLCSWLIATSGALSHGITDFDSTWYQLPQSARWVQSGRLTDLFFSAPETPDAFYSANGSIFHSIGMLLFRRDILSPVINVGWLLATFLAAWCIGELRQRGPHCVALVGLTLAAPRFVLDQGGSAEVDIVAAFFLLASIAFLLHEQRGATLLAGLAAGAAIGTKFTVAVAVVVLTLGLIATRRSLRGLLDWLIPAGVTSGFWFVRNLAGTGSPIPFVRLALGPLRLPYVPGRTNTSFGYSVGSYISNAKVWRTWFVPSLNVYFGRAWPILFVAFAVAIAIALTRHDASIRVVAFAVFASAIAYVVTPTSAWGPKGMPLTFGENLAYLVPTLTAGLCLLAVVVGEIPLRRSLVLAAVAAVVLVVSQGASGSVWRVGSRDSVIVSAVVVGLAAAAVAGAKIVHPPSRVGSMVAALAVIALAGWSVSQRYLERRYADDPLASWVSGRRAAIAEAGRRVQYDLYGTDLNNRVQYIGSGGPHGSFHRAANCSEWRGALRRGRFTYVILFTRSYQAFEHWIKVPSRELVWTRTDPAARFVRRIRDAEIFAFDSRTADPGCGR